MHDEFEVSLIKKVNLIIWSEVSSLAPIGAVSFLCRGRNFCDPYI